MRACYKGTWRLTRDSDRERSGFYWFCPEDTPFYPGLHNLWSYQWTTAERDHRTLLGDFTGERVFYDGRRPARRPLPVLVGSPECIENGEKEGLAVINDVSAHCSPILPGPCYPPLQDSHAKTDVQDCAFAQASARIISFAYTDLPAAEAAAAAYLGGASLITSFEQPNPLIPAGVIAKIDDTLVIWLTGTTTAEQLATQALYFGFGPVSFGPYSCSALYQAAALVIADQLTAAGVADFDRVILAGHSYGGAVLTVLTAIMILANEDRDVHLLTLGAPQPGDTRLFQLIRFVDQRHYANERDPIPYLPPRGATFAELLPIIGPALGLIWSKFHRPPNTTVVFRDGTLAELQEEHFPNDLINVAARVISEAQVMPRFRDHGSDWYAYWLCQACPCVPRPCVEPEADPMTFLFELDALEIEVDGNPNTFNVAEVELPATAFTGSGVPTFWAGDGGDGFIEISSSFFENSEDYAEFQVFFFPAAFPGDYILTWTFPAGEFLAGIDTTDFPVYGGIDHVIDFISLGGLHIKPNVLA